MEDFTPGLNSAIDIIEQGVILKRRSLCKKCPYSELFWSTFSRIRTEYGEICRISRIQTESGKIRTRITPNTDTFHAVVMYHFIACYWHMTKVRKRGDARGI